MSNPAIKEATVLEMDDNKMTPMAWKVLFFVFFAWVVDAADGTIYSLTLPMIREEFGLSLSQMGMVASGFLGGAVLGSFLLPVLAEKKGRRWGMVVCVSLYSIFTGVVGMAQSATQVVIGRFFTGWGTGAEWPIGAAYLSEMVPAKKRGWAMGIMQSGYPIGYFSAAGLFMFAMSMGWGWRSCYFILIIPALMCIPILRLLKESPIWLKNQEELAKGQLVTAGEQKRANYRELFKPQYRKYTIIATLVHIFNAIFSWGLVVWFPSAMMLDFHITNIASAQVVMFGWGVGTFGYLAAGRSADLIGRKKSLILYMCVGLLAVLSLNYFRTLPNVPIEYIYGTAALVGISLGVAGLVITYTSEIYPSHVRTLGLGFSAGVGKVASVFIPTALGVLAQMFSVSQALLCSTLISMIMIPVVLCGPETAKKKLEDIIN